MHSNDDLIDVLDSDKTIHSASETIWQKRNNVYVEDHPYIVGYIGLGTIVIGMCLSHLITFMVSFLFLYLISDFLTNDVRRYAPFIPKALLFSVLYVVVILIITMLTYKIIPNFGKQLPSIANQLQVEAIKQFKFLVQKWNLAQYIDPEEVRAAIVSATTTSLKFFMDKFSSVYKGFLYFLFALIVNLLFYHNPQKIERVFTRKPRSMMTFLYRFIEIRIRIFYFYFKRVMGGQIIISAINTLISAIVIFGLAIPHPFVMLFLVFFCGLFPVVGNLVSNTILTLTAFISIGLWGAGVCLILLVVIHKLEYFLNSRIIGEIVNLPMVVTLCALIISEVILGIVGLILAIPLVLYIRHEFEHISGFSGTNESYS
ncbi:MAG: AI-2E family transporter [Desulfobacterales bacterium]|nr:AI-2E family transporter [Desulfobacterales bacterium]